MKIGTFLNQIERAVAVGEIPDIDTGLKSLASLGLSYVDVTSEMVEKYSVEQILAWLAPLNITVDSYIHCLPFHPIDESSWEFYKRDAALQLDRCDELGCKLLMLVPEVSEEFLKTAKRSDIRNQIVTYAQYVTEQAYCHKIQTVIENYSFTNYPFSSSEDIDYILNQIPGLSFLLDTGNFWFGNTDMLEAARKFANRTAHVHLKDLSINENGSLKIDGKCADSVTIGSGIIPVATAISILKEYGYDGGLSVELNSSENVMKSLEASVKYLTESGLVK